VKFLKISREKTKTKKQFRISVSMTEKEAVGFCNDLKGKARDMSLPTWNLYCGLSGILQGEMVLSTSEVNP
jgi:hypothetical protein